MLRYFSSWPDHPADYAYDPITERIDDIRLFCRNPYNTLPCPSIDSCRAIRLEHCSHVIGYECFRTWLKRHPGACPYWNHVLPRQDSNTSDLMFLLNKTCSTRWFKYSETRILDVWFGMPRDGDRYWDFLDNLCALRDGEITVKQACDVFVAYAVPIVAGSICLELIIRKIVTMGFAWLGAQLDRRMYEYFYPRFACWDWKGICMDQRDDYVTTMWIVLVGNVVLFLFIVFCVLAVGVWRSSKIRQVLFD